MKSKASLAIIITLFGILAGLQSCAFIIPTGIQEEKTWDLSGFDRIVVDSAFTANISMGNGWSVSTNTDTAITDFLDLKVVGTTLHIATLPCTLTGIFTMSATITLPSLASLSVEGASTGNLSSITGTNLVLSAGGASTLNTGSVTGQSLTLSSDGASTINMDSLTSSSLSASSGGASGINISGGNLGALSLSVEGASGFHATGNLATSSSVSATITGASNASIDTSGAVTGSVTAASTLTIGGSPTSTSGVVVDITSHLSFR